MSLNKESIENVKLLRTNLEQSLMVADSIDSLLAVLISAACDRAIELIPDNRAEAIGL